MANGGTGGLLANAWTTAGPGTVIHSPGYLSILSNNLAYTSAYQQVTVVPGKLHRFSYTGEGFSLSQKVGATQEGGEYIALSTGVIGSQSQTFTPTTNSVWVQFQRLSNNTAIANDLRLTNLQPGNLAARSLNGINQFFYKDVASLTGFSRLNANFFIGGWWKFNVLPSSAACYLYDFGNLTLSSGGSARVRLVYSSSNNRLLASNMGTTGSYREHYITVDPPISVGTPVFLGLGVMGNGDPYPVVGTRRGGGTITGALPTIQNDLTQHIRIGTSAKTTPSATDYANANVWDVFWTVGAIPSDATLNAMAGGQRPHQIEGFSPNFLWPMAAPTATMDEDSITGLATMRQGNSPGVVAPPVEVQPVVSAQLAWMVI